MAVGVSVVVPTYKRHDLLLRCLKAVAAQSYPPECFEVVVCDDAASADTCAVVTTFASRVSITVRYVAVMGRHGPAAARNVGWRAACFDVIAFTDDDTIPEPDWISEGTKAIADAGAVAGRVIVPIPECPTDYERNESGLDGAEFVTANCFCRREVLRAVGGFDEDFTAAWREDSDLYFRLLAYADQHPCAKVVRSDRVRVTHPVRPAGWGISLRQQRKTMFDALLYRKHPRLYREKISPRPPWHYYVGVISALLSIVAICTGYTVAALVCAVIWAVLAARFCFKRLRKTSKAVRHVVEMVVTSVIIPFLSVYWRIRGAIRFKSTFF